MSYRHVEICDNLLQNVDITYVDIRDLQNTDNVNMFTGCNKLWRHVATHLIICRPGT